jgi:hypothetical protein
MDFRNKLVFVPGKPLQHSLIFVGKAGAYPSGAPLYCRLLVLTTNIRLGWKGFTRNKHSSLLQKSQITAVKSFIGLTPWSQDGGLYYKTLQIRKVCIRL